MNQRDIELLSAYLDGQVSPADSAKLESRLKTDPELESVLRDLRAARGILRKIPVRKAPRNFTLTRQMAGLRPPLPRTYPLFRLATVFASVLFLFSFTATALSPIFSLTPPEQSYFGMGGGGGCEEPCGGGPMETAPMEESAPPAAAEQAEPQSAYAEDGTRIIIESTPSMKEGETAPADGLAPETAPQPTVQEEAPVSYALPLIFLVISIAGGFITWGMYRSAQSKWR